MEIRIATRKSALALWQARHVAGLLEALPGIDAVRLLPLSTRGDEILDRSLQKIGGKGLFIKELEVAMQSGAADMAVHSMKDVPVDLPDGFCLAAMLPRANPWDVLVSAGDLQLYDLPAGARIGSSSLRRQSQLRMLRPDVEVVALRGNVNTRLKKLEDGEFDAIVLAAAGLERLDLADRISQQFAADEMLPASAQGVLGIECPTQNLALREIVSALNDVQTARAAAAERAVARRLQASCQSPVAAYATIEQQSLSITALVAHPEGKPFLRDSLSGAAGDARQLGAALADRLLANGAGKLLRDIEADSA